MGESVGAVIHDLGLTNQVFDNVYFINFNGCSIM